MTKERYAQWMAVWQWIQEQEGSSELATLFQLLNEIWQQDRQTSTAEEFAAYSQDSKFDIESDPEFQKFMSDLNSNPPKK